MGLQQPALRRFGPGDRAGGARTAGRGSWHGGGLEGRRVVGSGWHLGERCGVGDQLLRGRWGGRVNW